VDTKAAKIKALFEKAERTDNEAERVAYQDKANELMMKWAIDDAMLDMVDGQKREDIIKAWIVPSGPKTYGSEFVRAAAWIADAYGIRGIVGPTYHGHTLILVGHISDVERVKMLINSIWTQMIHQQNVAIRGITYWRQMSGGEKYKWRRAFIVGFGDAAARRLREIRSYSEKDSGEKQALVLLDRKTQVNAWIDANMSVRNLKGKSYRHDGFASGNAAGRQAHIGQTDVGGGMRALGR
jgi:hypothetical protein